MEYNNSVPILPSKTALVLLENSPIGMIGIDRIYMGSIKTGALKMLIFMMLIFLPIFTFQLQLLIVVTFSLWTLIDWARVMFNAISKSRSPVLNSNLVPFVSWVDDRDIKMAFWISLILLFVEFGLSALVGFVFYHLGIKGGSKTIMNVLGVEKYVPESMKIE